MKRKKEYSLWCRASYTIEAVYLMPMTLFLMVMIGTAAFYLHDRSAACAHAQAAAIYAQMLCAGNSENAQDAMDDYLAQEGTDGLLMTTGAEADGAIGTWKITAVVEGNVQNVFSDLFSGWGWPLFEGFTQEDSDWYVNPCTLIRDARILKNGEQDE